MIGENWITNLEIALRKSKLKVLTEILEICKQPTSKYRILKDVHLPWTGGNKYIHNLISNGILNLNFPMSSFLTTPKGYAFLEKWSALEKLI